MNDEIAMISRLALDRRIHPEILQFAGDDRAWLNLGAGLLAELAAEMITNQYPDAETRLYGGDELLLYIPAAAPSYGALRIIIMVKIE